MSYGAGWDLNSILLLTQETTNSVGVTMRWIYECSVNTQAEDMCIVSQIQLSIFSILGVFWMNVFLQF